MFSFVFAVQQYRGGQMDRGGKNKKKKKQARVSDRELGGDRGRRVGGVSARKG